MPKFLVISYDNDQHQTFFDCVAAKNEDSAMTAIASIRDYAVPCTTMTISELREMARELENAPEKVIKHELRKLNHQERG